MEYIIEMVEGFQDKTWPRIPFQLVLSISLHNVEYMSLCNIDMFRVWQNL